MRRRRLPPIHNEHVRQTLTHGENADMLALARLFNRASVHERRICLQRAAEYAGTVSEAVALELGKVAPALRILKPGDGLPSTLEARIIRTRQLLAVIHAAASNPAGVLSADDALDAIAAAARQALDALAGLRTLPADIANHTPTEER